MNTSDFSAGSAPGTPPGEPPVPPAGSSDKVDEFFDSIRRAGIIRAEQRWVGGVASGVALRLGIDALLVRVAFVVLFAVSGAGIVLYALGWALLPEQADGRIHLQEAIRGRFDSALVGAGIVFLIGVSSGTGLGWWDGGGPWFGGLFWVALTVFAVYALVTLRSERAGRAPGVSPTGSGAPTAQYPTTYPPSGGAFTPGGTYAATSTPAGPTSPAGPSLRKEPGVSAPPSQPTAPFSGHVPPGMPWVPPAAAIAPRPARSAGVTYVSSVLGLSLVVFAAFLLADRYGEFAYNPWLTAVGASIVLIGLAIVVAGLRGRSSGGLGFLAIVAIIIGAPAASWSSTTWFDDNDGTGSAISDGTYEPTSVETAEDGYSFGLGELTLDLTSLDLPTDPDDLPVTVPIELGAGDVTVILPEGVSASARVSVGAGQVYWEVGGEEESRGGVGTSDADFETQDVRDGATPDIHLTVQAGAGEIRIEEES